MGSSRFPGKPLAKIHGRPMIEHVYKNVEKCELLTKTVVATCDEEIFDFIKSINGQAVMTSDKHERASDRCAEALALLEQDDNITYDIVVMVQGDEPMTHPDMITEALTPMLENPDIVVTNLMLFKILTLKQICNKFAVSISDKLVTHVLHVCPPRVGFCTINPKYQAAAAKAIFFVADLRSWALAPGPICWALAHI